MRNICSNSSPNDCFLPLFAPHRNLLPYSAPIQTTHCKGIDGAPPLVNKNVEMGIAGCADRG
ncbi:hypothetical protein ES332_D08G152000v1 [Gossypium tomentosum]|uniref:Uncharacterized protein n=1 Tax=Gossypium tomentosum TaxID=34277 RepID=A0A5D2JUJ8_GOSTO|nr:hypothetical protein ES332_D08G152000v1 [Gossypium tomentosum]